MRNTLTSASGDSLKVTFNTKKSHREIKKVSVDSSKKAGFHKLKKKPVAKERCYCNEMYHRTTQEAIQVHTPFPTSLRRVAQTKRTLRQNSFHTYSLGVTGTGEGISVRFSTERHVEPN
jgi:hypothetical protein